MNDSQKCEPDLPINGFDSLGSKCKPKFLIFEKILFEEIISPKTDDGSLYGYLMNKRLCSPEPINK